MKKITSKSLSKRLAQYGALTAALGGIAETNGQVVYTDIDDFSGSATAEYEFDLNGDNTVDFTIVGLGSSRLVIKVTSTSNSVAGSLGSFNYAYPFALNEGAVIDANETWQAQTANGFDQILRFIDSNGSCGFASNWCSQGGDDDDTVDKYLGFKFKIGTATHYGWARLDVIGTDTIGSWLLKDFAYEATPDTPIAAGETLGVDDLDVLSKVDIVVTDNQIQLYRLPETTNYKLYSITGQEVLKGSTSSNRSDIETNGLTHGIYILEIEDTNTTAVFRKKVVLR